MKNQRFLIYGAGVIGSIFAGMLARNGFDVTVLARGTRFHEIQDKGIVLKHALSGVTMVQPVRVIDQLLPGDRYDYILITLQYTQVQDILGVLRDNVSPNMVFMVNNPDGYDQWARVVGPHRVMAGFPSAGGERKDGVVTYFLGRGLTRVFQSTTFGEPSGQNSERLRHLIRIMKKCGIDPAVSRRMADWQSTHVAMVLPIAMALYCFGSDNYRLSRDDAAVRAMILAVREGFEVLKKTGGRVAPFKLNYYYLPLALLTAVFKAGLNTRVAEFAMARHTLAAKPELLALEAAFRRRIAESRLKTPRFDLLSAGQFRKEDALENR